MDDSKKAWISLWGKCILDWPEVRHSLLTALVNSGIDVLPLGSGEPDFFLGFDHHRRTFEAFGKKVPVSRRVLVCYEPESVMPLQYRKSVRNLYSSVVVSSPLQTVGPMDKWIIMGNITIEQVEHVLASTGGTKETQRDLLFGMLNENKFSWVPGNQYRRRIQVLNILAKQNYPVVLGGAKWDMTGPKLFKAKVLSLAHCLSQRRMPDLTEVLGPHKTLGCIELLGRVDHSGDFLGRLKYQLVIENDRNYISEKLMDAIAYGTVPLYSGAPLDLFGLPEGICIRLDDLDLEDPGLLVQLESRSAAVLAAGREWVLEQVQNRGPWLQRESHERLSELVKDSMKTNW